MSNAVIGGNIWNPFDTDEEIAVKKEINKKAKAYHIAGVVFAVLAGLAMLTMYYLLLFAFWAKFQVTENGNFVSSYTPFPILGTWAIVIAGILFISAMAVCFRRKEQAKTGFKPESTIAGMTIVTSFFALGLVVLIFNFSQAYNFKYGVGEEMRDWSSSQGFFMSYSQSQELTNYAFAQKPNGSKESGAEPYKIGYNLDDGWKGILIYKTSEHEYEFVYSHSEAGK